MNEKINAQIFDKLRSKFSNVTLGDDQANATQDPDDATFFNFDYTSKSGINYGNVTVSVIEDVMKIYYSQNISSDLSGVELRDWYSFLQDMRKTAMVNLLRFDAHDISKKSLNLNDVKLTASRIGEGKMYGSSKSSYQKSNGKAKIIVRHSQKVDEEKRGARSRKIESIFIETREGERFKMPFNSLPGTRAMMSHVNAGGKVYDEIGESIATLVIEASQLSPFVRKNKNTVFEDPTTAQMVESATQYYAEARKTISKLKGKRGYNDYVESFQPSTNTSDVNLEEMKDRFDGKFESAMSVVHKVHQQSQNIIAEDKPVFDEIMDSIEQGSTKMNNRMNKPNNEEEYQSDEFEDWAEEMAHYEGASEEEIDCPQCSGVVLSHDEQCQMCGRRDDNFNGYDGSSHFDESCDSLEESPTGLALFARMSVSRIKAWLSINKDSKSGDPLAQEYIEAAHAELQKRDSAVSEDIDWPEEMRDDNDDDYFDNDEENDPRPYNESTDTKATYSDYQAAYRSNSVGGTDDETDIKSMLDYLSKKGKNGDAKTARNALKRMTETAAKQDQAEGLTLKESINHMRRIAGIIK